jgi:hypothetical protein
MHSKILKSHTISIWCILLEILINILNKMHYVHKNVKSEIRSFNIYVRLTVQLDAHYMYSLFLYIFALHVSGAI